MLTHYLKTTIRNMAKNKLSYLLTTFGIAVGITIFAVLYLLIDITTLYTRDLPDETNLFVVESVVEKEDGIASNNRDVFFDRRIPKETLSKLKEKKIPEYERMTIFMDYTSTFYCCEENNERAMFEADTRYVDSDFFHVIGAKFLYGGVSALNSNRMVVITDDFAKKLFGKASNALGKNIDLRYPNNNMFGVFTVVGVIKPILVVEYQTNVFLIENGLMPYIEDAAALVKLKSDVPLLEVNNALKTISKDFRMNPYEENGEPFERYMQLVDIQKYKPDFPPIIRTVILFVASIVLIIALFNFFSLLMSSVQLRIQQFTLRKIVGANQWTFMLMFLCEIIPILIGALLVNYVFLELLLEWYRTSSIIPIGLRQIDPFMHLVYLYPLRVVFFTFLACLLLVFLLTFRIQKIIIVQGIRGKLLKTNRNFLQNGFVFIQLLFTLLFFSISVALFRVSMDGMQNIHRTLTPKQEKAIFSLSFQKALGMSEKGQEVLARFRQIPGVEEVVLFDGYDEFSFGRNIHLSNQKNFQVKNIIHFEGYEQFFELKETLPRNSLAPDEAIVNETLAKVLAENNETSFPMNNTTYKIVGSVPFFPYTVDGELACLTSSTVFSREICYIKCHPAQAREVKKQIMGIVREYVPETIPYQLPSLYDVTFKLNNLIKGVIGVLGIATLMSLILTVFGVYSAVLGDIKRRRKENAIRKINGATYRNILWRYLKRYIIMLLATLVLLLPIHLLVMEASIGASEKSSYKTDTVFITWFFLTLFVLFSIYKLVRKAANENPSEVVKSE